MVLPVFLLQRCDPALPREDDLHQLRPVVMCEGIRLPRIKMHEEWGSRRGGRRVGILVEELCPRDHKSGASMEPVSEHFLPQLRHIRPVPIRLVDAPPLLRQFLPTVLSSAGRWGYEDRRVACTGSIDLVLERAEVYVLYEGGSLLNVAVVPRNIPLPRGDSVVHPDFSCPGCVEFQPPSTGSLNVLNRQTHTHLRSLG